MADEHQITVESIEAEFPGWEAFQGIDLLWHARIKGAVPPVMVHGEDLLDLSHQIKRKISKMEEGWHRPDG